MIRKSRLQLFVVGLLLVMSELIALRMPQLWLPLTFVALIGAYLIVWATLGRGYWCRQCKTFPIRGK
ncbi:MAG TPA: hypothetical protein VKB34_15685 [Povalibacter sp.]|nr:hypothetical protein [Povalibacter sp.]